MRYLILLTFILLFVNTATAEMIQLSGFVRDKQTNEVLIGANIWESSRKEGTTTDKLGYFNLRVNTPCWLVVSYVGYRSDSVFVKSKQESLLAIALETDNRLEEITITSQKAVPFDGKRLSLKELQLIPSLAGKPDAMKALQLIPGVQTQSEGLSLLMVRGGEPGQNQYLFDNVPLIYVNHLGGFMSVFNPDMINSIDLYKGNFPARHGGKLSSIVDITQREGNMSKHSGSFSVGLTDMSVSFEGPIFNKKACYIITARKTFVDAILGLATLATEENTSVMMYGFHDLNAKFTWRPNERNNLSLNIYQGDDYLNYWAKSWSLPKGESNHAVQKWGNWLISGKWNNVLSSKLHVENILSFSRYRNANEQQSTYSDSIKIEVIDENRSSVRDYSFRTNWKYSAFEFWKVEVGGQASYLLYEPSYIFNSLSKTPSSRQLSHSMETALFIDNKITISPWLKLQPSVRISGYDNGDLNFTSVEPRINCTISFSPEQSINLNYMKVSQTSHLVFTQALIIKKEIWLPATSFIPPQLSTQFSAGWNGSFFNGTMNAEANVYYKKMDNLTSLKEGYENMFGITGIENKIENNGVGVAYGTEFSLSKNTGKWTGSASYCWSYASRQFTNINKGKTYEYDFNRPHSINLTINHEFSKAWIMSLIWIFQSGIPYTPALGKQFSIDQQTEKFTSVEFIYGEKNSGRMEPYHRMDIGLVHNTKTKRGNRATWTYSIYNVYNRINPYNYYYDNDNDRRNLTYTNRPLKLYKIGLFAFMPSISYKVYFDYSKREKQQKKEKKSWLYFDE